MMRSSLLLSLFLISQTLIAQRGTDWLQSGKEAYEEEEYFTAAAAFEQFLAEGGTAKDARLLLGISYYETGRLDKASDILNQAINENEEPLALFYYARVAHEQQKFSEAAEYYKKYLPHADEPKFIKKQILHCRTGLKYSGQKSLAFIDNLGPEVNTAYDELAPITSPNHPNRLYFSSASPKSEGGKRDPSGYLNEKEGRFTFDMFRTEKVNGEWTIPAPLNPMLNTARNEILQGFTQNGLVAFFFRGFDIKYGEIITDTFSTEKNISLDKAVFKGPVNAAFGDKDLYFVNDSTLIYAAVLPEGVGGYDLYISQKNGGAWGEPKSLGPDINTPFHERTPSMNASQSLLFFSSDRIESIGGFDIFSASWNGNSWSEVKNLGRGINSASDDLYFVVGQDEYAAYLSSDRKSGYGGFDLYSAYFKEAMQTQGVSYKPSLTDKSEMLGKSSVRAETKKDIWQVPSLLIGSSEEGIAVAHSEALTAIGEKMMSHPELEINILSFSEYEGPRKYDLYFAMKRAENIAQFLVQQGVKGERVSITACGSSYPIVLKQDSEDTSEISPNRRIDFEFFSPTPLPFQIQYDRKTPIDVIENTPYQNLLHLLEGITYSVQIAATQQLYEGSVLEKYKDPLIRTKAGNPIIKYTIGIFDSYNEARNLRYQLLEEGLKGAFITAYLDGIRKTRDQLRPYVDQYEGLDAYINVE